MKWLRIFFIILLIIASILVLWRFVLPFFKDSNSFLKVTTNEVEAQVFLEDKLLGKTPYLGEKLKAGEYNLRLEAKLTNPIQKEVRFNIPITLTSQTLTAVNYEFGPNELFSSGDIRTFRLGEGLSVVTTPNEADVWLDGELVGKAPISLTANQGVHKLKIAKAGFVTRELEINIEPNLRLVVEVFLAANPFDKPKVLEDGTVKLYDLATGQETLLDKPNLWSEGVFFFEKNVQIAFDALIDKTGKTYFKDKSSWDNKVEKKSQVVIGYLGEKSEKGLTTKAKETLEKLKGELTPIKKPTAVKQVQILSTPTGTLNVRSGPGTGYQIVTKVKPSEKYTLLGEQSDWYKIKVSGTQGWISAQYAKKL